MTDETWDLVDQIRDSMAEETPCPVCAFGVLYLTWNEKDDEYQHECCDCNHRSET